MQDGTAAGESADNGKSGERYVFGERSRLEIAQRHSGFVPSVDAEDGAISVGCQIQQGGVHCHIERTGHGVRVNDDIGFGTEREWEHKIGAATGAEVIWGCHAEIGIR